MGIAVLNTTSLPNTKGSAAPGASTEGPPGDAGSFANLLGQTFAGHPLSENPGLALAHGIHDVMDKFAAKAQGIHQQRSVAVIEDEAPVLGQLLLHLNSSAGIHGGSAANSDAVENDIALSDEARPRKMDKAPPDILPDAGNLAMLPPPIDRIAKTNTAQNSQNPKTDLAVDIDAEGNNAKLPLAATFGQSVASQATAGGRLEMAANGTETAKVAGEQANTPLLPSFAQALATQERAASARPESTTSVPVAINDQRWGQQLGDRVVWLARNDVQSAQINITPAQLGPIQINISMAGDQLTAAFVSPHAEVRQALEEALPRLREMLAGAGINLGDANVGAQTPQQQFQQQKAASDHAARNLARGEEAILPPDNHQPAVATGQALLRGRGMVDLFA